ncbi:MAG: hypothetical protein J6Y56_02880 [Fibrobacterales bacterium]|nr:hypothetical protein [Fibrobacterales bacterium]
MALFATTFPVDGAQDASSFLEFVRHWLVATKGFSEEELSGIRGTSWARGGAETRTNGADLAGFRLREDGSSLTISFRRPWVTIYATDSGATAKRPQILRYLVGDLGEGSDDSFAVGGDPILLGNADIDRASRAVSGLFGREMPVVYVSAPAEEPNEKLARELAKALRDEAHVLVEPNRAFSKRLHDETGRNTYAGYVGLYWPNGAFRRVGAGEPVDAVVRAVRAWWLAECVSPEETWRASELPNPARKIREIRNEERKRRRLPPKETAATDEARKTAEREREKALRNYLREHGARGFVELACDVPETGAEELLRTTKEALESALKKSAPNSRRVHVLTDFLEHEPQILDTGIALRSGETDLVYAGERLQIARDALEAYLPGLPATGNDGEPDPRRAFLEETLERVPRNDAPGRLKDRIQHLLRGYVVMTAPIRSELQKFGSRGFAVSGEGEHYKLAYGGDNRYAFTMSKTGSDHRGGLNQASDIAKKLL